MNEKFIWLRVPKALLSLPGAFGFELLGRGQWESARETAGKHTHTDTHTSKEAENRAELKD